MQNNIKYQRNKTKNKVLVNGPIKHFYNNSTIYIPFQNLIQSIKILYCSFA